MMSRQVRLNDKVRLPPGLELSAISRSVDYIERECAELIDIYHEQANVFSAIVGIFGTKGLDTYSVYEKNKHIHQSQQRFPDLRRRGSSGKLIADHCLESKGSTRPWAIQSHYDHPGWYIVWRYSIDPTGIIDPGRPLNVWRVDVVRLEKSDWKYEGSKAGAHGGGRTHTFSVKHPAEKLRDKAAYERLDIRIKGGKAVPVEAN